MNKNKPRNKTKSTVVTVLTCCLVSLSAHATDPTAPSPTRRGFLAGLILSTGAAATAPSLLAGQATSSTAIPASVMRKLAALRVASLGRVDNGLEIYIKELTKIMETTEPGRLKELLNSRIEKAKQTLEYYNSPDFDSKERPASEQGPTTEETQKSSIRENDHIDALNKENQSRIENLGNLNDIPADIRLIMIRGLLNTELMNRMAWQEHFGYQSTVLNEADVSLLIKYRSMLQVTLENVGSSSFAAALAPNLILEVDSVLENSPLWHRRSQSSSTTISCKKMI